LGFENLTWAPLARELIEVSMLSPDENAWVDDYHAKVLDIIGPQVDGEVKAWLEAACAPL
ncbi:MAG: M24 family metallopeptidase C-terminal domain-containing protein, partial [Pseudomonadota bacterium]